MILVERWREIERLAREPDPLDVIQALLRLAPDRRSDALGAAKHFSHRFAAALRWALGSDEAPLELDADREPVWVAAARPACRKEMSQEPRNGQARRPPWGPSARPRCPKICG